MFNAFLQDAILAVVRHVATAGGVWLLTHGIVNASGEQSFIGSVVFLGGVAWSIYEKRDALFPSALAAKTAALSKGPTQ